MPPKEYVVKIVKRPSKGDRNPWARQCPAGEPKWGQCRFTTDPLLKEYDWLVVLDDLPRVLPNRTEHLACPRDQTILITSEPASVTHYGHAFARQFGTLITNQDEKSLPHPNGIRSQTGNIWFYGKTYPEFINDAPYEKTELISTLCSSKRQAHTMHALRYDFTQDLKSKLPELEIFGHGVRYLDIKADGIDPYRFHLVVENHIAKHVWTEKLADAFLGYSVPIYCGCTNVLDYFPEDSLIQIDIRKPEAATEKILDIVRREGEYERRLDAVIEARRRVIEDYNLPSMLNKIVTDHASQAADQDAPQVTSNFGRIYGRTKMRARHLPDFIRLLRFKSGNAMQKPFRRLRRFQ